MSPGARRNAVIGWLGSALKVAVAAPPERGKANAAVEALLAELLALPRGAVRVVTGQAAKSKRVEITGLDDAAIQARLRTVLEQGSAFRK